MKRWGMRDGMAPGEEGDSWVVTLDVSTPSTPSHCRANPTIIIPSNKSNPIRGGAGPASTLLLMSHPNRGFLAPKWVTHHFWEIHICGAAPLSINAILPICEGLIAARMTLCAVVNTSHPHIPETHQKSRMKAFVG